MPASSISIPCSSIKENSPPGKEEPILPDFSKTSSEGRMLIRAVASVCPYITKKRLPELKAYSEIYLFRPSFNLPPACVIVSNDGNSIWENLICFKILNVCGTPDKELTSCFLKRSQNSF